MHKQIIHQMGVTRGEYIASMRRTQPMSELERKAGKAKNKAHIYTAEELDLADARSVLICMKLAKCLEAHIKGQRT